MTVVNMVHVARVLSGRLAFKVGDTVALTCKPDPGERFTVLSLPEQWCIGVRPWSSVFACCFRRL